MYAKRERERESMWLVVRAKRNTKPYFRCVLMNIIKNID